MIALVTGATKFFRPVLEATLPSKIAYCDRHGYDLHVINFAPDPLLGFARMERTFDISHGYDATLWIDGDSVITNPDIKVEDIAGDTPFTASLDWWTSAGYFSTGNFIIRPDYAYLEMEYYDEKEFFLGHECQEQHVMNEMQKKWPDLFTIRPQEILNAVPQRVREDVSWNGRDPIIRPWQPGDFLAHLTGCGNDTRLKIIRELTA